jgi:hypothetical protein
MHVAYLDESYKRGEVYWLAAGLVPADNVVRLRDLVDSAAAGLAAHGIKADVELHGNDLFAGQGDFLSLKGRDGLEPRIRVFREVYRALIDTGVRLIYCGVEWNLARGADLDLHRMAAIDRLLPTLQTALTTLDDHCVVVADEEDATRVEVVRTFRRHQQQLRAAKIEPRLLDNIFFAESHDSRGVQALDLAAYVNRRLDAGNDRRPGKERSLKETQRWWEILRPAVLDLAKHPAP